MSQFEIHLLFARNYDPSSEFDNQFVLFDTTTYKYYCNGIHISFDDMNEEYTSDHTMPLDEYNFFEDLCISRFRAQDYEWFYINYYRNNYASIGDEPLPF